MPTLTEMKTDLVGIGHILKTSPLSVPKYQRSYAWTEKNVNDLFLDLSDAMQRDEEEYFLGSIVAVNAEADRFEVVDGQQRLATLTVLLAAVRDYFCFREDEDRVSDIERDYLMRRERRSQQVIPHLKLNDSDHDFFSKRILARPGEPERVVQPTKESHQRLDKAAVAAAEFVGRVVSTTSEPAERLMDWLDYIDANAKVIWVRVRDDANAFTIFETLNDRGLALAITDLLKNYLFSRSRDRIDEVQQRWLEMTGVLEPLNGEEVVLNYVRHYWSSKHGVTRKPVLYSSFKERTTSKQAVVDLAGELLDNAHLYEAIISPDSATWGQYDPQTIDHMSVLDLLGMVQIRPLLLAVMHEFAPREVGRAMRLAVSWAVRFVVVGNLGGGVLESHYSRRAVEVRKGAITSTTQLAGVMNDVVPSDVEFRAAFETASVPKANVARYYLRTLDLVAAGNTMPALVANTNPNAVNLEHVLPQNPSPEWGVDDDTVQTYYNRLGNLALLEKKMNKEFQNSPFERKAGEYKESAFRLTRELGDHTGWGVREIQERQQRLARLAVAAWPI